MSLTFESDEFEGCRFDEFLNLGEAQKDTLVEALRSICDADRKRARTAQGSEQLRHTLGLIAANALKARADPRGPACFYSRGNTTYSARKPYNPAWLSVRVFIPTIDKLTDAGLLGGVRSRATGYGDGLRSTLRATDAFIAQLAELGITADNVEKDEAAAPVLVLKGEPVGDFKPWIAYDRAAPNVQALEQPIRAYNAFLREQELSWVATDEALAALAQKADENGRPIPPPNVGRQTLRRVFNDGSWDRGGRFYGGWWELVPSDLRRFIRINDEPVVELDYCGFLPRAIYHRSNIELPGDAYEIPEIKERSDHQGLDWREVVRPSIKRLFAVILNARARVRTIGGVTLPRRMSKTRAYELIEAHHQPIADWFYSGRGVEVMNDESNICQRVLSMGAADNVPVLPIHDSFIVPASCEGWLRQQMTNAYHDHFGFDPLID